MTTDEAVESMINLIDGGAGSPLTVGGTFKECKVDLALPGFEMVTKSGSVFQVIVIEKHAVKLC